MVQLVNIVYKYKQFVDSAGDSIRHSGTQKQTRLPSNVICIQGVASLDKQKLADVFAWCAGSDPSMSIIRVRTGTIPERSSFSNYFFTSCFVDEVDCNKQVSLMSKERLDIRRNIQTVEAHIKETIASSPSTLFILTAQNVDNITNRGIKELIQDEYTLTLSLPPEQVRRSLIVDMVAARQKCADEKLIDLLVNLTEGYEGARIEVLMTRILDKSRGFSIKAEECINELQQAIEALDQDETIKAEKQKQLTEFSETKADSSSASPPEPLYPLLDDVYFPEETRIYFQDAAEQLKQGKFRPDFRRTLLFYGKPGVGKGETVQALINESGCDYFRIKASELVERYQGSGAESIKSIFTQAKQSDRGVIIFIDELQNLAPATVKEGVDVAHKYEGQDYRSTLSQIWTECDDCARDEHANIMIIVACNEFELIDQRVRERFKCMEFAYPDAIGRYEILQNKSRYYEVELSEEELKEYAEKLKDKSGRKLTTFIRDAKTYISQGMSREDALKRSHEDLKKTIADGKSKSGWDFGKYARQFGLPVAINVTGGVTTYVLCRTLDGIFPRGPAPSPSSSQQPPGS